MGELAAPVVVLRVTVRAPDLDAFITRYSRHIAGDRIFIFSKAPQPVGTAVRFNLQLQTGEVLIQGKGTVKRVQKDAGDPRHPPGMEVQFTPLDERSATLVDFMMATRAGLTEAVSSPNAAPIVRAVVPPKPKPLTPLPKLAKPAARPEPPPPLPPVPVPVPSPAPKSKSKPVPVARPPSLSLESVWKSEAGDEATSVSPPPSADSQPLATNPGPSTASGEVTVPGPSSSAASESAPMPLLSPQDSSPSLLSLANLSSLPPGAAAPMPGDALAGGAGAASATATATATASATASATADADAPPTLPPSSADLATIIPPTVDPSVNAPPVFAESWGGDAPANPFSDVSDGAIEYFVEWSLEQSIGPRALPQAQFSDVPMALPGQSGKFAAFDPLSPRRRWLHIGAVFAGGALVGGLVVGLVKRAPRAASAPLVAAVEAPRAAAAAPAPAPPEAAPAADRDGQLAIVTRPPGASVSIDGSAKGTTPLTAHLPAGKHEISVTKERYAAITTTADAPGKLALDLRRPSATLHVTSTPPAAEVIIGGEHRGKTPIDVRLPGFESYDVRVALAGAKPWRKTIYLSHAQNRVDAALAKSPPPRAGRR